MRLRTLFAITLTMFALPALAAETPLGKPVMLPPVAPGTAVDAAGCPETSVVFEVRTLKVPVGFCERAGVKLTGNTVLGEDDVRRLLEATQARPDASVMQFPKVTAADGEAATVRNCEERSFVTGVDAKRVKGQTVLVPRNTPVELGDTLTLCGNASRDGQTVTIKVSLKRVRVAGEVELIPVATKVTPVFEGGSQGQPITFTQFIQSPDVRTETVEKHVVITSGHTIVLGSWKETETVEQPARGKLLPRKAKPAAEYEVVAFATARVFRCEEPAVAPMPHEAAKARSYPLRNAAAADVASTLAKHFEGEKRKVRLTFDAATNTVFVSAEPALMEWVLALIAALDKAPAQVMVQAVVVKVPRDFVSQSGLSVGNESGSVWTLTPREAQMLSGLLRAEKERGGCEVLARPQLCVCDGQTGVVQAGGSVPMACREVKVAGGKVTVAWRIEHKQTGLTLKVTPTVKPDSGQVSLTAEGKFTSAVTPPAQLTGVMFTNHTFRAAADLRDGHTLVIAASATAGNRSFCGSVRAWCERGPEQTLVILTPHIVAPQQR